MNHKEACEAMKKSYKDHNIDALKEARDKALKTYEEANITYLTARDAYHKVYRNIWR